MCKKFIMAAIVSFVLGVTVNNFAMSNVPASYKVGIVDLQQVVKSSSQVNTLQKERVKKAEEIKKMIEKGQKEIAAQTDETKKKELVKKYDNDIRYAKNKNNENFTKKLADVDKSISNTIQTESKKAGYDLVLAKGVVLYGGTDITNDIIKVVK